MWLGAATWIVFELPFLFVAVSAQNAPLIITVYAVRGLAYPLFARVPPVDPGRGARPAAGSAAGFFGVFGDHVGWRRTVTVFGCLGCAVATPLWYFGAIASQSFLLTAVLGAVYGIVLAGFVPLSALMLVIRSDVDGVPPRRRRSERPDGVTGGSTTGRRSQLSPPRRSRSGGAAW
jgi:MFS family permease